MKKRGNSHYIEIRLIEYGSGEVLFKSRAQMSNDEQLRRLLNNARLRGAMFDVVAHDDAEKNRRFLFGDEQERHL